MLESGVYQKDKVDVTKIMSEIQAESSSGGIGAIATFLGVVKKTGAGDKEVVGIEVDSYVEHASLVIQKICREVRDKYTLEFVHIFHLMGSFTVGELLVFVAVGGKTRGLVFPALQEAVERYKREPALFKKEIYTDSSHKWISHA
jgi:molybdopterin synthase catalytic subunit